MANTFKQKAAVAVAIEGVAIAASACSSFAPKSDIPYISAAVRSGIAQQTGGKAKQDCSFHADDNLNVVGAALTVKGTRINWYASSTDNGYVCVGKIVNTGNPNQPVNVLEQFDNNGGRPIWPLGYISTQGNVNQPLTTGSADLLSNNQITVNIYNGPTFPPGLSTEQTISTISIPGFEDPFAVIRRN